jgi:hypothetical protein
MIVTIRNTFFKKIEQTVSGETPVSARLVFGMDEDVGGTRGK